jgi:hypothetical protein
VSQINGVPSKYDKSFLLLSLSICSIRKVLFGKLSMRAICCCCCFLFFLRRTNLIFSLSLLLQDLHIIGINRCRCDVCETRVRREEVENDSQDFSSFLRPRFCKLDLSQRESRVRRFFFVINEDVCTNGASKYGNLK